MWTLTRASYSVPYKGELTVVWTFPAPAKAHRFSLHNHKLPRLLDAVPNVRGSLMREGFQRQAQVYVNTI